MKGFSGSKLKDVRILRKLSLADLSSKTDLSKQLISIYENDDSLPDINNVLKLASALDVPVQFFYKKIEGNYCTDTVYFRSLLTSNKKDLNSAKKRMEYITLVFDYLSEFVDLPKLNVPDVSFSVDAELDYEEIAKSVRDYWGLLDDMPITNLKYLFEKNGIFIVASGEDACKVDAFSRKIIFNNNINYVIGINDNKSYSRFMFDIAHELGHILLHPWSENLEDLERVEFKCREKQANEFASVFLMPKSGIEIDFMNKNLTLDYFVYLKSKWGISIQALIARAYKLEYLTFNQYDYLMRQISKKGFRKKEPLDKTFSVTESVLNASIERLFEENELDFDEFYKEISDMGLALFEKELVEFLRIDKKYLKTESTNSLVYINA